MLTDLLTPLFPSGRGDVFNHALQVLRSSRFSDVTFGGFGVPVAEAVSYLIVRIPEVSSDGSDGRAQTVDGQFLTDQSARGEGIPDPEGRVPEPQPAPRLAPAVSEQSVRIMRRHSVQQLLQGLRDRAGRSKDAPEQAPSSKRSGISVQPSCAWLLI